MNKSNRANFSPNPNTNVANSSIKQKEDPTAWHPNRNNGANGSSPGADSTNDTSNVQISGY